MRTAGVVCCLVGLLAGGARAADEAAQVKAVLNKAFKALGGEAKLKQFRAATWKGEGTFHGLGKAIHYQGEWAVQPPEQARIVTTGEFNGQKFERIIVLDGDRGWTRVNGVTEEMDKDTLAEEQERLHAAWVGTVAPLREQDFQISFLGESKVGKQATVGLRVAQAGYRDVSLYFDGKNGLLLKSETRIRNSPGGVESQQETFYAQYKEFGGIRYATRITVKVDGKALAEGVIRDYEPRNRLEPATFARAE